MYDVFLKVLDVEDFDIVFFVYRVIVLKLSNGLFLNYDVLLLSYLVLKVRESVYDVFLLGRVVEEENYDVVFYN